MHKLDVWQVADIPPGFYIFPEGPEGVTVTVEPLEEVLANVG